MLVCLVLFMFCRVFCDLSVVQKTPSDANILSETLRVYERDNLPNIPKMALRELC